MISTLADHLLSRLSRFFILPCLPSDPLIRTHAVRLMHWAEVVTTKSFSLPKSWSLARLLMNQ